MKKLNNFLLLYVLLSSPIAIYGQVKFNKLKVVSISSKSDVNQEMKSLSLTIYKIGKIYYNEYSGSIEEFDMVRDSNKLLDTISSMFVINGKVVKINDVFLNIDYKFNWIIGEDSFEIIYASENYIGVFISFISGNNTNIHERMLIINTKSAEFSIIK